MSTAFAAQTFSGYSGCSGYSGSGGGGGSNVIVTMTAGQNIANLDFVYVARSSSYGQTAGSVYKTDATYAYASFASWMLGFATAAATTGDPVTVQVSGVVAGLSGLTPGAVYYPDTTAGAITATASNNAVPIGFALSATTLILDRASYGILPGYESLPGAASPANYGYFAGGYSSASVTTSDKITFSTGITAANTASDLTLARRGASGLSDGAV